MQNETKNKTPKYEYFIAIHTSLLLIVNLTILFEANTWFCQ